MFVFVSSHTNPYFNAALEEYLCREKSTEEFLLLYKNDPAVVIGKHQNALAEIALPYVSRHRIAVLRRMSGGGAVYHDPGNINFTVIRNFSEDAPVPSMNSFLEPVCRVLKAMGINASTGEKNDIRASGRKISGNAWHVNKNRVLHHGTLLFNTPVHILSGALNNTGAFYTSLAVASNRSEVTNIAALLPQKMPQETFEQYFLDGLTGIYGPVTHWEPSDSDYSRIFELMAGKYLTWEWNFAYSPSYEFHKKTFVGGHCLKVYAKTDKGTISMSHVRLDDKPVGTLHNPLNKLRHRPEDISIFITQHQQHLKPLQKRFNELLYMFF